MPDNIKEMVKSWIESYAGDREKTARFMAYTLRLGSIGECRKLIEDATGEAA